MLHAELKNLVREGWMGIRLLWKLPPYLRRTVGAEEAKAAIRHRIRERENSFLRLLKNSVFGYERSPYLKLMRNAGCEFVDVANSVKKEGLEDTLRQLYRSGVYLTLSEFRGERETVRGDLRFFVDPAAIRNPLARRHIPVRSSGSRSRGTEVVRDLDYNHEFAFNMIAYLDARQSLSSEIACWGVPGGTVFAQQIRLANSGSPPAQWYSQVDTSSSGLSSRYSMSGRVLKFAGILAGVRMPKPLYVPPDDPIPIIYWMRGCLDSGQRPHLFTYASSAVRLVQRSLEESIDLHGGQLTVSGEPVTRTRLEFIKRSGAEVFPHMGCVETGSLGQGCLTPETADDMHLLKDMQAVIQPGPIPAAPPLPARALLFSSLRPRTALVLLNVSLGDQAVLKDRACGCPLGRLGLDTHLHDVRSFEKLTSGGMAFLGTDIIRILEERLPKEFGGSPTDYQLIEDEGEDGGFLLRLRIHPAVGELDEAAVIKAFLKMVGSGPGADRITSILWGDREVLTVERGEPRMTASGKIQFMHLERQSRSR